MSIRRAGGRRELCAEDSEFAEFQEFAASLISFATGAWLLLEVGRSTLGKSLFLCNQALKRVSVDSSESLVITAKSPGDGGVGTGAGMGSSAADDTRTSQAPLNYCLVGSVSTNIISSHTRPAFPMGTSEVILRGVRNN